MYASKKLIVELFYFVAYCFKIKKTQTTKQTDYNSLIYKECLH